MKPQGSGLQPLEVASGLVFGANPGPLMSGSRKATTPLAALEGAILPSLLRPPCLVSFSGGRDSSAVLAVAAGLARREGLPLPIPATNRFAAVDTSREDKWQERVVTHLELDDWARLEHENELDCLGPIATQVLLRHGLLWPFNAHFHVPLLRLASGGALLTGIGGDELLSESSWAETVEVLTRRRGFTARDVLRLGLASSPASMRAWALARRFSPSYEWLHPQARQDVAASWAGHAAHEPLRWRAHVRWVRGLRYLEVGTASLGLLAGDEGVELVHPFLDQTFAGALMRLRCSERFPNRTGAMRTLFHGMLPDEVLARSNKASFDGAFWNTASRTFAAEWDGSHVDLELVDNEALKIEWMSDSPDARSYSLAQSAWLHGQRASTSPHRVQQAVDRLRE